MKKLLFIFFFIFYNNSFSNEGFLKAFFFTYENDSVYGPDRYYSNGVQLSFITNNYEKSLKNYYNYSFGIGHKIYTPYDIKIKEPIINDRAYAGYLYLFLNKNIKYNNVFDSFGVSLGFTGDLSFGEDIQKVVHKAIKSPEPMGWDNQIDNEFLFMLSWLRTWQLKETLKNDFDWLIIPKIYTNLGTPFTSFSPSIEFRYGWNLQENDLIFNKIDPILQDISRENSYYAFLELLGNISLYNTFLDKNGRGFNNNIDKEFFGYNIIFGLNCTINNFYIKYSNIYISKEFNKQIKNQLLFSLTGGFVF